MNLQERMTDLISHLCQDMHEREEIVAVSLLAALCGQNTFLYGPPGTAKSLISRRIACAFEDVTYFEYLMNRFSTPEEVFGPVSIKALKEDSYMRKTENYLPKANFAFLDEIWKSSPAILNTLLTLINEHIFKNGQKVEQVPLMALIAASNETPDKNQGLEALYDRFIVRLMVEPIKEIENFNELINRAPSNARPEIPENIKIKKTEWQDWSKKIHEIQLSKEVILIIHLIRDKLTAYEGIYISDRRWQRAATLIKASAFFNNRKETNHSDALLLEHCIWTNREDQEIVKSIVASAVKEAGFECKTSLAKLDDTKERLDREINNELYHTDDVYQTVLINNKEFLHAKIDTINRNGYDDELEFFIPKENIKSSESFNPVDKNGNAIDGITCDFDNQGACTVTTHYYRTRERKSTYNPKVLFHKGDKKQDVNDRLKKSLSQSITELKENLIKNLHEIQLQNNKYQVELHSPFLSSVKPKTPLEGITNQIQSIELRIEDCKRLEALCQ